MRRASARDCLLLVFPLWCEVYKSLGPVSVVVPGLAYYTLLANSWDRLIYVFCSYFEGVVRMQLIYLKAEAVFLCFIFQFFALGLVDCFCMQHHWFIWLDHLGHDCSVWVSRPNLASLYTHGLQ